MKNLMLPIFVLSFFLLSLVNIDAAPIPPYSIAGQLSLDDGSCVTGFNVKAKAFSFSEFVYKEISVPVNENCEYQFALGNAPFDNWNEGMSIELTFCDVSKNSACYKKLVIGQGSCESGGGCRQDFIYKSTDYTPAGEPIVKYVEKIVEKIIIKCQDGTIVEDINECLETKEQIENYFVGGGITLVAAGAIWYLIRHYSKKGKKARAKKMADTRISRLRKK